MDSKLPYLWQLTPRGYAKKHHAPPSSYHPSHFGASRHPAADAITLRVSAPALERSLKRQVFTAPGSNGKPERRYLRGDPTKPCSAYVDDPHITFRHVEGGEDRIVVSVHTHATFGKRVKNFCLGIPISIESEVSFIPVAEGESIGFRDARIEHASNTEELNVLLEPFLASRLPAEMKVNAAKIMRTLLVRAPDSTGYTLTLTTLQLHSMQVDGQALVVDLDAEISVD